MNFWPYGYHLTTKQSSQVVVYVEKIYTATIIRSVAEEGPKVTLCPLKYQDYIFDVVWASVYQLRDTAHPSRNIHIDNIAKRTILIGFHKFDTEMGTTSITLLPDENTSGTWKYSSVEIVYVSLVIKDGVSYYIVDGRHHRSGVTDLLDAPRHEVGLSA